MGHVKIDINLNRKATENCFGTNVQTGTLIIQKYEKSKLKQIVIAQTLENTLYKFPDGKYPIKYEYSPKFKGKLWELYGITGRSEIKVHVGTRSNHSRGCILVSKKDLQRIHKILEETEENTITVQTT